MKQNASHNFTHKPQQQQCLCSSDNVNLWVAWTVTMIHGLLWNVAWWRIRRRVLPHGIPRWCEIMTCCFESLLQVHNCKSLYNGHFVVAALNVIWDQGTGAKINITLLDLHWELHRKCKCGPGISMRETVLQTIKGAIPYLGNASTVMVAEYKIQNAMCSNYSLRRWVFEYILYKLCTFGIFTYQMFRA